MPIPKQAHPVLEHQRLAGIATTKLRESILAVDWEPGAPITVQAVSDWLGISRTPAQSGLDRMVAEGLVERVRNRYRIVRVRDAEARDARQTLEWLVRAAGSTESESAAAIRLLNRLRPGDAAAFSRAQAAVMRLLDSTAAPVLANLIQLGLPRIMFLSQFSGTRIGTDLDHPLSGH